jgi:alpha-ribazole phosphatase
MKPENNPLCNKNIIKTLTGSSRELNNMKAGRTRLYLARHGELTTSKDWKYVGHMDVELNDAGIKQISNLAERLKSESIEIILSSDLKRASKSAEIIGNTLGVMPEAYNDFREINIGKWEGLTRHEIINNFQKEFEERSSNISTFQVENGESFLDVHNRVIPCLMSCLKKYSGKDILLVAHGGVNRIILCHALGLDINYLVRIDQSYACLNIIDYYDGVPVVHLLNETT